jgi:hypothetical protein
MCQANGPAECDHLPGRSLGTPEGRWPIAVGIGLSGMLFFAVANTQGRLNRIFVDFGYDDLPAITNIARSQFFLGICGALFAWTIVEEVLLKSAAAKGWCRLVAGMAAVFLGGLYVFGMFRPLIVLVQKLS